MNSSKAQKEAISEELERYVSIFQKSHTPMLVIDSEDGSIRDSNLAASNYYGYSFEQLKKLNISDINTMSKIEIIEQMKAAKEGSREYFKFHHKLASGEVREVEVYSGPIALKGETLLLSIVLDVQYKREMERRFQIQESYFKSLYEHSPEAIAILDCEFRIVNINKSFEKIFQYKLNEIVFQNITSVICDESLYDESTYFKDCITKGEFVREETKRRRKDGSLIDVSILGYPIMYNEEQIGVYLIYSDITKNKLYEEELMNEKRKAEEANMFKTMFIANIAHEIRTPMNGILGIIDLFEDTKLTGEQKEYFSMLRYSADRLSNIINDVIDVSKLEAGKNEIRNVRFNIYKLLRDVGKYFRMQAEKNNIELFLDIDNSIPRLLIGDPDKLNQVLFNLLSNAIKFTEQGFIRLKAVAVKYSSDSTAIEFSVSDTGIGIPQDQIKSIFEDFYQLDSVATKKYRGAGLGLAISKRLVELMGGSIDAVSEPGLGSKFYFNISFTISDIKNQLPQAEINQNAVSMHSAEILSILVVEDESINQQIIKSFLEKRNYSVKVAGCGREGLNIYSRESFDIILLDVYMPEIDGFELARIIRTREKALGIHTPIIAVTAAVMDENQAKYMASEIDAYIAKPFTREQLYKAIDAVSNKHCQAATYDLMPALDSLEGSHELLKEIAMEAASEEYKEEFLGKIGRYIQDKDIEGLSKQLHKFKGSISHFKFASINRILSDMKACCSNKDFDNLTKLYNNLNVEYASIKNYLLKYLQSQGLE